MQGSVPEEAEIGRLKAQRNLFAVLAVCAVASIGVAAPRKLASYREMQAADARLLGLQADIVDSQQQIRAAQEQIVRMQQEIRRLQSQ